jgi:hypothetical protein
MQPADAPHLYEDLLVRANGDVHMVSLWLAEMGYDPAHFLEQQQQAAKIKAVGTRSHTLGSGVGAGSSKAKLGGTGAPCFSASCICSLTGAEGGSWLSLI